MEGIEPGENEKIKKQAGLSANSMGADHLMSEADDKKSTESKPAISVRNVDDPTTQQPPDQLASSYVPISKPIDNQIASKPTQKSRSFAYRADRPLYKAHKRVSTRLISALPIERSNDQTVPNVHSHVLSASQRPEIEKMPFPSDSQKVIHLEIGETKENLKDDLKGDPKEDLARNPKNILKSMDSVVSIHEDEKDEPTEDELTDDESMSANDHPWESLLSGNQDDQESRLENAKCSKRQGKSRREREEDENETDEPLETFFQNGFSSEELENNLKEFWERNKDRDYLNPSKKRTAVQRSGNGGLIEVFIVVIIAVIAVKFLTFRRTDKPTD